VHPIFCSFIHFMNLKVDSIDWLIDWLIDCLIEDLLAFLSDWLNSILIDWFIGYYHWLICWLIELELAFTDWFGLAFGDVCALALTQCTIHPIWVVTIDWLIDCCGGGSAVAPNYHRGQDRKNKFVHNYSVHIV
jgi:hypothetical protein